MIENQPAPCYNKFMQAVYCGRLFPKALFPKQGRKVIAGQFDETVKTIFTKIEETKEETDDARRWVDLIQKYSAIDEFTDLLLNELIEKIVVHQSWKDGNGRTVRDIEIYYRFVGKID